MRKFTRKFIETQSDEWLNDFYNDYDEANEYKKVLLKEHFQLVKKEIIKRNAIESAKLYKAESTAEYGQYAMDRLDGAYDMPDVGDPSDNC